MARPRSRRRPTLTISGTIVYLKGTGFFRQDWTKSDAGFRTVVLPRFAVGMLMARNPAAADNLRDAIFASRRGTWLSSQNVRCQLGHGSKEITRKYYIDKPALAPDSSEIFEQLAPTGLPPSGVIASQDSQRRAMTQSA